MGVSLDRLQAGEGGLVASCVRAGLSVLAGGWALAQGLKSWSYGVGLRKARRLDVPVISVGNLTVGGTGKTPFVIALAEALRARGRHPGILARGYRRADGARLNDEGLEIERALGEDVPQMQDPDRVRGGRRLLEAHADVDVILLDDGFQHRRLHRDVDVVLLDATLPFGHGHLLPRGRLRERPAALRRAHVVVCTRSDLVDEAALDALKTRIGALTSASAFAASTRAQRLVWADRVEDPEALCGRRIHAAAAVGQPAAVKRTLERLGAEVASFSTFPDHRAVAPATWARLLDRARSDGASLVITRKDAVKLDSLPEGMAVLEVATDLSSDLVDAITAALP